MYLATCSDAEILAVVNPMMDNLMQASTAIDHASHTRDFTDRLKAIVTEAYLRAVCQHYQAEWGYFTQRECVAIFRRPNSIAVVWKQECSLQPGEFVAELVLVQQDDRYLIDHVMVY